MTSVQSLQNYTLDHPLAVQSGDVLGFSFPGRDPIPYDRHECYSPEEQLRYLVDPEADMEVGTGYNFQVAALAWGPCRDYSLLAIVGLYMDRVLALSFSCCVALVKR